MKNLIIILLPIISLFFNSCTHNENGLTSPTSEGKGTLSCIIDGKVWNPKTDWFFPPPPSHILDIEILEYNKTSGNKVNDFVTLTIKGFNSEESTQFFF